MIGFINTIFNGYVSGVLHASVKAGARSISPEELVHKRFKSDETITFFESDMVPSPSPYTDAITITSIIASKQVAREHFDNGSAVNIIYTGYFWQMDIDLSALQPATMPLSSFAIDTVWPVGTVTLPITVAEDPTRAKYVTLL